MRSVGINWEVITQKMAILMMPFSEILDIKRGELLMLAVNADQKVWSQDADNECSRLFLHIVNEQYYNRIIKAAVTNIRAYRVSINIIYFRYSKTKRFNCSL